MSNKADGKLFEHALSSPHYRIRLAHVTGHLLCRRHRAVDGGFPTGIGLKMEPVLFFLEKTVAQAVLKIESA